MLSRTVLDKFFDSVRCTRIIRVVSISRSAVAKKPPQYNVRKTSFDIVADKAGRDGRLRSFDVAKYQAGFDALEQYRPVRHGLFFEGR
jgi:hypothetical protein